MTDMDGEVSVAIIGGGAIGTSLLFQLSERGHTDAILFEKDQLGSGATSKAAGGVRHVFDKPQNVEIGKQCIGFFENFESIVGYPVQFSQTGYMYLLHDGQDRQEWKERRRFLSEHDVRVELLSQAETVEIFPRLRREPINGAVIAPECGHVDPARMTHAYARRASDLGATVRSQTRVVDVYPNGDGTLTVETDAGSWSANRVVNAAGPWAPKVADMVGLDLPIGLMARHIAVTEPIEVSDSPLIIDSQQKCYFRAESNGSLLVCDMNEDVKGVVDPTAHSSDSVGYKYFKSVSETLSPLLRNAGALRLSNGWVGVQSHTPDKSPILGETPIPGFWVACGLSGHGIQKSPLVGAALAEQLLEGETDQINLDRFRLERFDSATAHDGESLNM